MARVQPCAMVGSMRRLLPDRDFDKAQVPRHRPEVAIVMQQRSPVFDAPGADQQVDGFANCYAASAQAAKIARRNDCDCVSAHWRNLKPTKQTFDLGCLAFATQTGENLAHHQVADYDLALAQKRSQFPYMWKVAAVEEVDPDRAVDNNHATRRPARLRPRSPRQRYLPKALSASRWRWSLIRRRSASSTVAFLVAWPDSFWASAKRASSMSILVRIDVSFDVYHFNNYTHFGRARKWVSRGAKVTI
jgi:hypothetical protein